MAGNIPDACAGGQDEIAAARRAAMLKLAIQQQEAKRYALALDMYRRPIEGYPGSEEEIEAGARMLDLARLFEAENQPHRMLSVYNTLETTYFPSATEHTTAARKARVGAILQEVHQHERREAEAQARFDAIREGKEPAPGHEGHRCHRRPGGSAHRQRAHRGRPRLPLEP